MCSNVPECATNVLPNVLFGLHRHVVRHVTLIRVLVVPGGGHGGHGDMGAWGARVHEGMGGIGGMGSMVMGDGQRGDHGGMGTRGHAGHGDIRGHRGRSMGYGGREGKQGKSKAHGVYHVLRTAWGTWRMGQVHGARHPACPPVCPPTYLPVSGRAKKLAPSNMKRLSHLSVTDRCESLLHI